MLKIKDQVEALCRQQSWVCISPVFECLGISGLLKWKCSEGHEFQASVYNAKLMVDCPVCRRIKAAQYKAKPEEKISKWKIVPVPDKPLKSLVMTTMTLPVVQEKSGHDNLAMEIANRVEGRGRADVKPVAKRKIASKAFRPKRTGMLG